MIEFLLMSLFQIIVVGYILNIVFAVGVFIVLITQLITLDRVQIGALILRMQKVNTEMVYLYSKFELLLRKIAILIPFYSAYLRFLIIFRCASSNSPFYICVIEQDEEKINRKKR